LVKLIFVKAQMQNGLCRLDRELVITNSLITSNKHKRITCCNNTKCIKRRNAVKRGWLQRRMLYTDSANHFVIYFAYSGLY